MHILSRHSNEAHHSSCHEVRDRVARVGAGQTRPNRGIQQFRKIDHGQERGRGKERKRIGDQTHRVAGIGTDVRGHGMRIKPHAPGFPFGSLRILHSTQSEMDGVPLPEVEGN